MEPDASPSRSLRASAPDSRYRAAAAFQLFTSGSVKPNVIQDWSIVGPFPEDFAKGFAPETDYLAGKLSLQATYKGAADAEVKWQRINEGKAPGAAGIDFLPLFKPNANVTAYATTKVISATEQDATLLTGSDDGIVVWLNGQKVHSNNACPRRRPRFRPRQCAPQEGRKHHPGESDAGRRRLGLLPAVCG